MPPLHADRMVREGETMAVRRSSRAGPGRVLSLLVAVSLGIAVPALADDTAPAAAAAPVAAQVAAPALAPAVGPAVPGSPVTAPPAVAKPAMPVPPIAAPPVVPPEKAGDRADAIARDVVLHPPQKQMPEPAASSLRTMKLKLGGLLDRSVHGPADTEVGRVIDVLLGEDGKPAALEMDVGGFMGVGNRKIVVAWALFDIPKPASTDPIRLSLTDAQVKSAPSAEESGEVTVVTGVVSHVPAAASPPPAKPAVAGAPPPGTASAGAPSTVAKAPVVPAPAASAPAASPLVAPPLPTGSPAVPPSLPPPSPGSVVRLPALGTASVPARPSGGQP